MRVSASASRGATVERGRGRAIRSPQGTSIVEVLVALVLVSVAALSLGRAASAAAALLREAAMEQGATMEAESVIDSLVHAFGAQGGVAGGGMRQRTPWTVDWMVVDSGDVKLLDVSVRYVSGSGSRTMRFHRWFGHVPRSLPAGP